MKAIIKNITTDKTIQARRKSPMNTMFVILLAVVVVASVTFFLLLFRLSLEGADVWLKVFSVVLGTLTFLVGASALVVGHFANERQAEKVLTLERGNLELQSRVEQERLTRLQLEESLERRILIMTGATTERLKKFAGTPFVIEALSDGETLSAAGQIRLALTTAGWRDAGTIPTVSEPDGVRVETMILDENPLSQSAFTAAGAELVSFLEANGWDATSGRYVRGTNTPLDQAFTANNIPNETLRVRIGNKQNLYFMGKLTAGVLNEQAEKAYEESRRENRKRREGLRQEWGLPPRRP
jgi:hypothetical protein